MKTAACRLPPTSPRLADRRELDATGKAPNRAAPPAELEALRARGIEVIVG